MNNFPAMTEERRQHLIARLIRFRNGIQAARDANMQTEADEDDDLIAQIALAALTAEPELWEIINPGEGTYYSPHGPRDVEEVKKLWYPAPPAPVLRVPDGWIKCSDQMPEKGQSVLASGTWFEYAVISWDGKNWLDLDYEEPVTHWRPLPPPSEASNEQ